MSRRHAVAIRTLSAMCGLALLGIAVSGCDDGTRSTVITQPGAEEMTGTLTPIQRGEIRRSALQKVRDGVEAWQASDVDAMRDHFADDLVAKWEAAWEPYTAKGQRIEHVHELDYLDVIELNKEGTQALVTYRYDDNSYVVDASGARVEELPPFALKEIQFTLEFKDDSWTIVRAIAGEDAYR